MNASCLRDLLVCSVSCLSLQNSEPPNLLLMGLKAARHCCTAPARLSPVLGNMHFTSTAGTVRGQY